ncbi:MAG: hypothetical protein OQK66_04235 [Prosthecochloris sp.]|nr:hypothetical protein [Prosthecochloris sp.]
MMRQLSFTVFTASACLKAKLICSSLKCDFFMSMLLGRFKIVIAENAIYIRDRFSGRGSTA